MSKRIRIANEAETLSFFQELYGPKVRQRRIHAFYSSTFNKIITQ